MPPAAYPRPYAKRATSSVPYLALHRSKLPCPKGSHHLPVVSYTTISPLPNIHLAIKIDGIDAERYLSVGLVSCYQDFVLRSDLLCGVRTFLRNHYESSNYGRDIIFSLKNKVIHFPLASLSKIFHNFHKLSVLSPTQVPKEVAV